MARLECRVTGGRRKAGLNTRRIEKKANKATELAATSFEPPVGPTSDCKNDTCDDRFLFSSSISLIFCFCSFNWSLIIAICFSKSSTYTFLRLRYSEAESLLRARFEREEGSFKSSLKPIVSSNSSLAASTSTLLPDKDATSSSSCDCDDDDDNVHETKSARLVRGARGRLIRPVVVVVVVDGEVEGEAGVKWTPLGDTEAEDRDAQLTTVDAAAAAAAARVDLFF